MTTKTKPEILSGALEEFLRKPEWATDIHARLSDTDITILTAASQILIEAIGTTWIQQELPLAEAGTIPVRFADRERWLEENGYPQS